jgi:hypothetical protein
VRKGEQQVDELISPTHTHDTYILPVLLERYFFVGAIALACTCWRIARDKHSPVIQEATGRPSHPWTSHEVHKRVPFIYMYMHSSDFIPTASYAVDMVIISCDFGREKDQLSRAMRPACGTCDISFLAVHVHVCKNI